MQEEFIRLKEELFKRVFELEMKVQCDQEINFNQIIAIPKAVIELD